MTDKQKIKLLTERIKTLEATNKLLSKANSDEIKRIIKEYKKRENERLIEFDKLKTEYKGLIHEMETQKEEYKEKLETLYNKSTKKNRWAFRK